MSQFIWKSHDELKEDLTFFVGGMIIKKINNNNNNNEAYVL